MIGLPAGIAQQKQQLEAYLYENVYRHPSLIKIREQAQARVKEMYVTYCESPSLIPPQSTNRGRNEVGVRRMAVEYIAGMTDHFFEQTYKNTHT